MNGRRGYRQMVKSIESLFFRNCLWLSAISLAAMESLPLRCRRSKSMIFWKTIDSGRSFFAGVLQLAI
jgi:hypothetical protein